MSPALQVTYLDPAEVLSFVRYVRPEDVTVTGWVGSGYSFVTDIVGDSRHTIALTGPWSTPYLLLMRDRVTPATEAVLADLGLGEVTGMLGDLPMGSALLVTRIG